MDVVPVKTKTFNRLVHAFFVLENEKGHMRWSVAQLARSAKVSRSLVYKYLGSTKKDIALGCLRCLTENVYGFEIIDQRDFAENFTHNLEFTRARISHDHEAILFYQKWRVRDGWIRDELVATEEKFHRRLGKTFPHLKDGEILALRAALHGFLTAPFIEPAAVKKTIEHLIGRFR